MKVRNLLALVTAGMFAFTSCSNDDDSTTGGKGTKRENGNVVLKIEQSGLRAVSGSVATGAKTPFEDGAIFFAKADGTIERYVTISNTVIGAIKATDLESGVVFENVDADATEVVVVGNYSNFEASYANISEIEGIITDLEEQYDGTGGINKVTLFGRADIVDVASANGIASGADYEALPEIAPIASRFEIVKMTYTDTDDAQDAAINASLTTDPIKLEGIYLNNIYYKMDITGQNYSDFFNYGQDIYKYFRASIITGGNAGEYLDSWSPFVFDDNWDGSVRTSIGTFAHTTGNKYELEAGSSKVWAYNFFAHATTTAHIVFHFSNVYIIDDVVGSPTNGQPILRPNPATDGVAGECYLTARNYKTSSTNPLEDGKQVNIAPANVYKITDLTFNTGDFDNTPEGNKDGDIDVYVEVSVMPWTSTEVKVVW